MRIFFALTRRELAAFFVSITGYVIIAAATFLIGLSFVVLMTNLGSDPSPMPVSELFYRTYYFWLIVLLATPIIPQPLFRRCIGICPCPTQIKGPAIAEYGKLYRLANPRFGD